MSKLNTLIKKAIQRKKIGNPQYSLRAIALKIGVQHSFLSALLNNKKNWPLPLLDKIVEHLDMDELSSYRLSEALIEDYSKKLRSESKLLSKYWNANQKKSNLKNPASNNFLELPQNKMNLLTHWYYIPLMDLTTCSNFKFDFDWISKKLGITNYEAKMAWQFLSEQNYISETNGKWEKKERELRLPTKNTIQFVQKYHHEMINKGLTHIRSHTDKASFDKRLIAGLSVATNLENIQHAKDRLHETAYQIAEDLSHGPCTDVYQIYVMLYPITNS